MEPSVLVVGCKNPSLGVVPPFLQERKGVVGSRNDVLQAMWADWIRCVLRGSVGGVAVRKGRKEVRQRGFVVAKKSDGPCVETKLNGSGDFGC